MEIIARRMQRGKEYFWVFFESGNINGIPIMMMPEEYFKECLKTEGFELKGLDK